MLFHQQKPVLPFCFWFSNEPAQKVTLHFPLALDSILSLCSVWSVRFPLAFYFHLHLSSPQSTVHSPLDSHLQVFSIQIRMQVRCEKCQVRSAKMRSKKAEETWSSSNSMPLCERSNSTLPFEFAFSQRCISSFYFLLVLLSSHHLLNTCHIPLILNRRPL